MRDFIDAADVHGLRGWLKVIAELAVFLVFAIGLFAFLVAADAAR